MKKNTYTPKIWGRLSLAQLALNGFFWNKINNLKSKKTEDPRQFTIKLDKFDQERYLHSFLKKRILTTWKEQRTHVQITSRSPEQRIYQDTYNRLKPLLLASYTEDFKLPYTEFTFRSWLQYAKLLAQVTGRYRDARHWEELSNFIYECSKCGLVDF